MVTTERMSSLSADMVKIAAGSYTQARAWGDALRAAGVEYRVIGEDRAGLGTAAPGSVELWVRWDESAAS